MKSALLLLLLAAACGGPRETATSAATEPTWSFDADAGTCEDRARVRPICVQAMRQRCRAQVQTCESSCETQFGSMPGNSDKEPGLRGDIESNACRERCSATLASCAESQVQRCPQLCAP